MSHRPTPGLVAALIVRDEERSIVRCLDNVRPWVDRIVVLDTGSRDRTVALASGCGAEVHHMAWPDSFATARNRVLDIADADWTLMIDADNWIVSGGDALRGWIAGPPRLGVLCIHEVVDAGDDAIPADRGWVTRLLPRGVRYEGRVHEQPVSDLPRARIDLHYHHDGYVGARLTAKSDRNRPLLLRELNDRPDDAYVTFQLGKDAAGRRDHAAANDWYARSLAATAPGAAWRHELVLGALTSLNDVGRVDDALALADTEFPAWQGSPDFFFLLGTLLLARAIADPAGALDQWLPLAESAWERCLAIGERPDLAGSIAGRGSHLAQQNLAVLRAQTRAFAA